MSDAPSTIMKQEDKRGHAYEITCLEAKIKALCTHLEATGDTSDMEEMLVLIHRQGWTTPQEIALVSGMVDSMQAHVNNLTEMRKVVLSASRAIELKPQQPPPGWNQKSLKINFYSWDYW